MQVGFVGLGELGMQLALNLLEAGHALTAFDLRPEALREISAAGARIGGSPGDVAARSEVIMVCVVNGEQVVDVARGDDGILSRAAGGSIVVVHSTVGPRTIAELDEAAGRAGVRIVDAPVSGGAAGARARTMFYMVGGAPEAVEQCMPLFRTSASRVTHAGAVGSGMKAKLVHQLMLCVALLAAREGYLLGERAGLSPEALEQLVRNGGAQSRIAERWPALSFPPFAAELFRKDLSLALEMAEEFGLSLPATALARDRISEAILDMIEQETRKRNP